MITNKQSKIIVKSGEANGDYSLIGRNERKEIINIIKNEDIISLEDYLFRKYKEYYIRDLLDYLNHSFDLLLDFKDKEILNIGCGEGTEPIFLAKFGEKRVYALEKNKGRLDILKVHASKLKISNKIIPIAGDFTKCDIKESSFDIITMIGVLEWLPKSNPYKEQLKYLKKVRASLRKNGKFLLAIENRLCPLYFTGKTNHGDLPFTPLMPRFLANMITKLIKGKPYTTYTYSDSGYKKILKKAGYKKIKIYPVIFSYQEPRFIINSCETYKILLRKFGISPVINFGAKILSLLPCQLLIKFSPSYIIIGEK